MALAAFCRVSVSGRVDFISACAIGKCTGKLTARLRLKPCGHLIPVSAFIFPAVRFFTAPNAVCAPRAPLLKEKTHFGRGALFFNVIHPGRLHRAGALSAFAADDNPMNATEFNFPYVFQQRLDRQKADFRFYFPQFVNARHAVFFVFNRRTQPGVRGHISIVKVLPHSPWPFGKNLISVLRCFANDPHNLIDKIKRYFWMEQVRHGIDKPYSWLFSPQGNA